MFPDPKDPPATRLKLQAACTIAIDVLSKLARPELSPRSRTDVVIGAPVPEAAIDEDGHTSRREDQVWLPWQPSVVKSISEAPGPEQRPQQAFRLCVPAPYASHLLRPGKTHACLKWAATQVVHDLPPGTAASLP